MKWNKFTDFFSLRDSDTYCSARDKMCQIRESISDVLITMPDVTIAELVFVKDKWQELPKSLGFNVKMLGLSITKNVKTVLTEFGAGSQIFEHGHVKNYETLYVKSGTITVTLNGNEIVLSKGDQLTVYVGSTHSIVCDYGAEVITRYAPTFDESRFLGNESFLN